jgi:predicted GH43/DUF377 family glycosyl hydrolase
VENKSEVGVYRTFWALLDRNNPEQIIHLADREPLLEANSLLTREMEDRIYLNDVVFTTGIVEHGNDFLLASGELDLACRITRISKEQFLNPQK